MPLLWVMKVLVLWVPNNRLTCMQGQKTLSLSYNMHLFLPTQRLPNDSLNDSFFQTPPLRDANLRWLVDWSHFHFIMSVMSDKVVFVECSAALCTALPGNRYFYRKRHLVAKNEFAFSFRPTLKDQQVGGQYANVSCWRQHETAWDSF